MSKDVLFEIGLEELPARFIDQAEKELKKNTAEWLKALRINYDSITSYSTPRRLSVVIASVSEKQSSIKEEEIGRASCRERVYEVVEGVGREKKSKCTAKRAVSEM